MAITNLKQLSGIYASNPAERFIGTGAPASSDEFVTDATKYPLGSQYINLTTKIMYIRTGVAGTTADFTVYPLPGNDILTFDFLALTPDVIGVVDATAHTVALLVPFGTTVTALVATFTLSPGASAVVGATAQVSGTTANNFTSAVTYIITGSDGAAQNWIVTVTIDAE